MIARRIKAVNAKPGDVLEGQRIKAVHKHVRRCRAAVSKIHSSTGVVLVLPAASGYGLDVKKMMGEKYLTVKRPKYNLPS